MAWTDTRTITIDNTKCGTADSTNFPMLFYGTYDGTGGEPDLRTTGNGGDVTDAQGDDIAFYSDSGLTTLLDFERVAWNGTTGACEFYIRIPTLKGTGTGTDTVIYMGIGNTAITTYQGNNDGTWNANYLGVYHMEGNSNDSSGNAINGTDTNITYNTSNGKLGQGAGYGASAKIRLPNDPWTTTAISVGAWIYITDYSVIQVLINELDSPAYADYWSFQPARTDGKSAQYLSIGTVENNYNGGGTAISTSTWYRVWFRYSSSVMDDYRNGVVNQTGTPGANLPDFAGDPVDIGAEPVNSRYWAGNIDELNVLNTIVSTSWMTADWNNQNSPSTFYTIGAGGGGGTAIQKKKMGAFSKFY